MLREDANQKDTSDQALTTSIALKDSLPIATYSKTSKLITALYIVTDIMEKDEPLRVKLRDLGTGVLSDINNNRGEASTKIKDIMSFLDIASAVRIMSDMNCNILRTEFMALDKSIKEFTKQNDNMWLEDFLQVHKDSDVNTQEISKGQSNSTRIGVQKASTLLHALNKVNMSDKISPRSKSLDHPNPSKDKRRDEIIRIIKSNKRSNASGGLTISDIRQDAKNSGNDNILLSSSEKTLQRELLSMVHDNVLKKTGEKRWSKYFL